MRIAPLLLLLLATACSRNGTVAAGGPAAAPASADASAGHVEAVAVALPATDAHASAPTPKSTEGGIAWHRGDVDAAFAEARQSNKPLFLYWGAAWCPPCNQVKATIFNREDFIERSRAFVAVYIDGDAPNAQQLGARFKVSGYPSMLLFRSDGKELTRLPGEVEAQRYMDVLTTGMNGGKPVVETLRTALEGGPGLTQEDWRMLAYYSWETDEQQLVGKGQLPETLGRLARACPAQYRDLSDRLALEAINASATATPVSPAGRSTALPVLEHALADRARARESFDILTDSVGATLRYATDTNPAQRKTLLRQWDAMLESTSNDTSLSQADRLGALASRIELARVEQPKGPLPAALVAEVRRQVERADHETDNAYERQSVINVAAQVLSDAGLMNDSDALLKAELSRSHAPYYFMVDLSQNAKRRGDTRTAIDWLARAYQSAEGPATRLQWGVLYVRGLTDMAPKDDGRIESVTEGIIAELAGNPDLLYERNRASLARLGRKLSEWNKGHEHDAVLSRIHGKLAPVCAAATTDPDLRSKCEGFFAVTGTAT